MPPHFNKGMLEIWEELWHGMPQSGSIGVTVRDLLRKYKERCQAAMKTPHDASQSPPALLPVSYALAKDWLLRQQRTQSKPLESGSVNEEAREVIADLNRSLDDQTPSAAELLEQPVRPASPVIVPPELSLGPEVVTGTMRAEERYECSCIFYD